MANQNDLSIAEYIGAAERNLRSSLMPPGYFAKQTYLQVSDVFTATYGRKVWDALNNQTRFWNILRKVQWGPTTGWRVRSDRGSNRSRPVTETGALPTVDVSAYQAVDSAPRIMATDFGVSLKSQIMSGLEGGMGDNLAVEQEAAARDHIKELNSELLLRSNGIVTTGGASATGAVLGAGNTFRIGDTISDTGLSDASKTISGIAGNVLTYTGGGNLTDGAIAYAKARAGLTSIDDIVEQDARTIAGVTLGSGIGADVYNQTTRTAGAWNAAATVLANSGTGRNLTLSLLDQAIREVRINGADPDVILMGYDQFDRLSSLLQAQQRYMDWGEFVVKVGDESTLPGSHAGFQVATYRGIPVIVDPDINTSFTSADAELGSNVYVLDTRYLELAVAAPTQYIDNRDFFQANAFVLRGLFYTIGELRALRVDAHAKITDLNA